MRDDKSVATEMRKKGASYSDIYKELRVPKATLSDWFGGEKWSQELRDRLAKDALKESTVRIIDLDKIRGEKLSHVYEQARKEAREEFERLKYHPLFIAGLMLYWGEGDKVTKHSTRLINTDPVMIKLFVNFLLHACKIPVERIRAQAIIYPDIDPESTVRFWSERSGIPTDKFSKCSVIKGRHKIRRISRGTCTVCVSSTYFKVKVLEWLSILPNDLMSSEYYENMARDAGIV